jgi:glycosyltransferase involved in cell wall biosynthesis
MIWGFDIVRHLLSRRPDILVSFGWRYPANLLAMLTARSLSIPYVLYGDTDIRATGRVRPQFLRSGLLRLICSQSAGALYTGTYNRDFYVRYGIPVNRLWFSPWAVDNARFHGHDPNLARAELGIEGSRVYFLSVGRLIPRKRWDLLIQAVSALQNEGFDCGLLIAGSGPLEDGLRRQVDELNVQHVQFLGFVKQSQLPSVYAAADVFALCSDEEPRGAVINEAMASGLPVIISDGSASTAPNDLVRSSTDGYVFPRGDLRALLEACRALTSSTTRQAMGDAARHQVRRWSYDIALQGWKAAARSVVGAPDSQYSVPHDRPNK